MRWDLLVNATPLGTYPNVEESPLPGEWLTGEWVYDLVYNPKETRLLKEASRRGCKVIYGSEMLLAQAVEQQSHWFGTPPPEEIMQSSMRLSGSMTIGKASAGHRQILAARVRHQGHENDRTVSGKDSRYPGHPDPRTCKYVESRPRF
jgi:hypothetical protein